MPGSRSIGLIIRPSDLPAPPQAAIEIMRACARQDMNNEEIARLIAGNPLLAIEILRISNSAFYGPVSKVRSVAHAINILGLRTLRNIALCLSVRGALQNDPIPGLDINGYWEEVLRYAICARLIGKNTALDADECFTAGLFREFGLLVLFYLHPDQVAFLPGLYRENPEARQQRERELFGTSHEQVALMLAAKWRLPQDLVQALDSTDSQSSKLELVLHDAGWMSNIFGTADKNFALGRCRTLLAEHFAFDAEQMDTLFKAVPEQLEEAAQAMGLHINQQVDFDKLLSEANVQIIENNLSNQELNRRLEKALEERNQLARELDKELKLAREIQQTLLPPSMGESFPVSGINVSARYLSGDFYDYFTLDDGRIYFNLGDVSGKGTNAAIMMAKVSSLFHCIGKQIHDPGRLMCIINDEICETASRGMFITMAAGLYDPEADLLRLVNAGHPPVLVFRKNFLIDKIGAEAPPLGVVPAVEFPEVRRQLGDTSLYMYSDGITEGHIDEGRELGLEGLIKVIAQLNDKPPQQRLTAIVDQFRNSSVPLRDDVTLLLLEKRPDNRELLTSIRFPAKAEELSRVRLAVTSTLSNKELPADFIDDFMLAVTEACANIIQHANQGKYNEDIILEIFHNQTEVTIMLTDFAAPLDASRCKSRELHHIRPGGLGIHFMQELMDEVQFLKKRDGKGNALRLTKRISTA
jgi:sigma-B regulation protein RsbU (phosphoserine phosphatase)